MMNDEMKPNLLGLFSEAEENLDDEGFVSRVTDRINRDKRFFRLIRVGISGVVFLCLFQLAPSLQELSKFLNQFLFQPLVELHSPLLTQILYPLNNVIVLVLCGLIILRFARNKLFG